MTDSIFVFVVDSRQIVQQSLEKALTEGGFFVTMASTGEEAIAMLDAEGTDYSALVTGISLEGSLTGWDVARHARGINDRLPVILMSTEPNHALAEAVPNIQVLEPPFAAAQVVHGVAQLIGTAASPARIPR